MKLILFFFFITSSVFAESSYKLTVSDGTFKDKVILKWDSIPEAEYYQIMRIYNTSKMTKLGKEVDLETNTIIVTKNITTYTDNTIPFGQHLYIVNAVKNNISPKEESKRHLAKREKQGLPIPMETNSIVIASMQDLGYRQVSDQEFFLEFQKTIDSALPRIRTMKMLNFFGEKKKGWKNGQLVYKTTGIIRKPFKVMINFTDFIDQNLKLNGTYEVQIFKLLAQEGKLVGTFTVDGIYKGTVTHNLIIHGGQSVGGTYDVQQDGGKLISLPWDITTHPLDDSRYEDALKSSLQEAKK